MILIKKFTRKYKYKLRTFLNKEAINLAWDRGTNFGDAVNPILIENITKKKILWCNPKYFPSDYLMAIGSILQKATSNALIWGSGYITKDSMVDSAPRKIYAVRGPLTRKLLLSQGIECPEVYGDPALLLPKIYNPKITKKYKLGVIPHYIDKEHPNLEIFKNNKDINIIDIKDANHYNFIDNLLSCEKIISSSLHGIIVADAYNIPSIWIEFSKNVKGDGFKFLDYFSSVNRVDKKPFEIQKDSSIEEILKLFYSYKIEIDLEKLIESCPYHINLNSSN